jgi:hypothetical protein
VSETDAVGTSTTQVFTGQTMSRNGGPSAVATANVVIVSCTITQTCAGTLSVPATPTVQSQTIHFSGAPTAAVGTVHAAVAPASLICPEEDPSVAPVTALDDTGFDPTARLTFTTTLHNTIRASAHAVCYSSSIPFLSQADPTVPAAGTALLLDCSQTANVAPCVASTEQVGSDVVVTFVVPGGDPRFYVVCPAQVKALIPAFESGTHGKPYSAHFTTSGGKSPITWRKQSGSLPTGLRLDPSTGDVSGTPTAKGSYTFALQANDSLQPPQSARMSATITIK